MMFDGEENGDMAGGEDTGMPMTPPAEGGDDMGGEEKKEEGAM